MSYKFEQSDIALEERLDDLIEQLNLEEKIGLVPTRQIAIPRLNIPEYHIGGEGAHGFVDRKGPSTTFPQTIGLAASWDKNLLYDIGTVIGREGRAYYNEGGKLSGLSLWFPTIDMERDPRWGRTEEAYGEDPVLCSNLACAIIKGTQGDHPFYIKVSCAPKHFFANNNELDRVSCSCSIDPRNRQEYYLEAFRESYTEAGAFSMMTAYNEVNGIPMMCHPIVRDVVKKEWGLEGRGHIVTDGGDFIQTLTRHAYTQSHAQSIALAFKNGVDTMTDNPEIIIKATRQALEEGLISEDDLNKAVRNTLRVRMRYGQFDPPGSTPWDGYGRKDMMTEADKQLARLAVSKSAVLLKNDAPSTGKPILPIQCDSIKKLAVIGPLSDVVYTDWYTGNPSYTITPLEGLKKAYPNMDIQHCTGDDIVHFETSEGMPLVFASDGSLRTATSPSEKPAQFYKNDWGFGAHTFWALDFQAYLAPESAVDTQRQPGDDELANLTKEEKELVLRAREKTTLKWFVSPLFNVIPYDKDYVLLKSWDSKPIGISGDKLILGSEQGEAFPLKIVIEENGQEGAKKIAATADLALVFLGNNPVINGKEEIDRPSLNLPQQQSSLLQEVCSVQEKTALILISSYPYTCAKELALVPAAIHFAHGMQEMGRGLADIISGKTQPAGRLPMTWYKSEADLPDIMHYDIIEPGTTYQYFPREVLFPFGYGLSYSSFEYSSLKISDSNISRGKKLIVSFKIKNTGNFDSDEVPQLYVRVLDSFVKRPLRSLRAFDRIHLKQGEERQIEFTLSDKDFMFWDVNRSCFALEQGRAIVYLGRHSLDIALSQELNVIGERIPERNLYQETLAETYNSQNGCYLHRHAYKDSPAVYNKENNAYITFERVNFDKGSSYLIAEIASSYKSSLELSFLQKNKISKLKYTLPNTGDIASIPHGQQRPSWTLVHIPLPDIRATCDLRIAFYGKVALHSFKIQAKDEDES